VRRRSARRAAEALDADVEEFERGGCRPLERRGSFEAVLEGPGGAGRIRLRMGPVGRFFGGSWGMEASTDEPVLPATAHGLSGRGRGVVKQQGVRFRARRGGGTAAERLAEALTGDAALGDALNQVHFEEVSVEPDGRPVIRHMGGSVIWVLLPPVVRATPLPEGQPKAILAALAAFRRAGRLATATDFTRRS
jgi:hypothetical protein